MNTDRPPPSEPFLGSNSRQSLWSDGFGTRQLRMRGLLQPLLYRITLGISALRKILLLDSFLILAICEQWWLVGRWLDAREGERKPVKFKRGLAMLITIAGLVSAILCRARDFWEFVAALVAFLAAIAWLVLLVTAAVAVAKSVRSFFRGTPTPQN